MNEITSDMFTHIVMNFSDGALRAGPTRLIINFIDTLFICGAGMSSAATVTRFNMGRQSCTIAITSCIDSMLRLLNHWVVSIGSTKPPSGSCRKMFVI
jgi:hypothetical protein